MANKFVLERLKGIQTQLMGAYAAGSGSSSSAKGAERESIIDLFLSKVLPPRFRFGTGDATDLSGQRSGQLDVVIEYGLLPSLPAVGGARHRLYLAEGIAAVIEVKSNLANQWGEVLKTYEQLAPLERTFGAHTTRLVGQSEITRSEDGRSIKIDGKGTAFSPETGGGALFDFDGERILVGGRDISAAPIPPFAIGYTGWKKLATLQERYLESKLSGVLVVDAGLFVGTGPHGPFQATGPHALWALICCLSHSAEFLKSTSLDPIDYVKNQ